MQRKVCGIILLAGVVALALWLKATVPQKRLAHRLAQADRLVVTNVLGASMTLNPADSKKLLRAIAAAKKVSPDIAASPDLWIGFYEGTDLLAALKTCGQAFWLDEPPYTPYADNTGTFEALGAGMPVVPRTFGAKAQQP